MSTQTQSIRPPRPTPKRVLVLGSTGMVGRSWMQLLERMQIPCTGLARPVFNLMDLDSIQRSITAEYDLVINAAAWTDVDGAESDEQGATQANAHAIAQIAQCCKKHGSALITYSTDYVFPGNATTPYPTDAPIDPINAYGRSKALGEQCLGESNTDHILIRTSWVYAPWGTNFVRTIHNLAQSKRELQVVNDQRGRPTSAQQLAAGSLDLYHAGAQGIWHLTDGEECTWFDFACEIIKHSNLECAVRPCTSDQYPRPAKRPAYSTLDLSKTNALIGDLEPWPILLGRVLDTLNSSSR